MPASNGGSLRPTPHIPATPDERQSQASSSTAVNGARRQPNITQSSDGVGQSSTNAAYLGEFLLKLAGCTSVGEVLKLLPVPVQPVSRDVLDGVFQASHKLGGAQALLLFWQDRLRSQAYADVAQLNSIKAPIVQVSKEAIGPNDGGLSSMNLDACVRKAKEAALHAMIAIKELEVENLRSFVNPNNIAGRLRPAWDSVVEQNAAIITGEHQALLADNDVVRKVSQVVASIGESASERTRIAKDKRSIARKEADVDMTDVSTGNSKKQLASVVEEVLKRREQSRRDRAQSGKGKRSSGISKQQTKKTQKKQERTKKSTGPGKGSNQNSKPGARRRERR